MLKFSCFESFSFQVEFIKSLSQPLGKSTTLMGNVLFHLLCSFLHVLCRDAHKQHSAIMESATVISCNLSSMG